MDLHRNPPKFETEANRSQCTELHFIVAEGGMDGQIQG